MLILIKYVDLLKEIWEIFMKFFVVMNIKCIYFCLVYDVIILIFFFLGGGIWDE